MISRATYRQILASSSILLCAFIHGCRVGFTQAFTWMNLSSHSEFKATETDLSWVVAVSYSGTLSSLVICYIFGTKVGRRRFICCTIFVYSVAWLSITLTSSVTVIIICMFFYGIASSMLVTMGNIYFGEVSSPRNREILGVFYPVMSVLGSQIEFALTFFGQYKILALFPFVMCIFAWIFWYFMVESPCYLISAGQRAEAIKNLQWLNDEAEDSTLEEMYGNILKYVNERETQKSTKLKILFVPNNFRLMVSMIIIQWAATINCRTIVMLYGSVLVKNFSYIIEERLFVNIYSAALTFSTILGLLTVTRCRRKLLLLFGFHAISVIQAICAYSYFLENRYENKLESLAIVIAALLIVHGFISTCSYSPALSVLKGEVFPFSVKEICGSIMSLSNDCAAFLTTKFYFAFASTVGLPSLFLIYTFFTSAGLLSVYFNVNDTKGKTLREIRSDYLSGTSEKELSQLSNIEKGNEALMTEH